MKILTKIVLIFSMMMFMSLSMNAQYSIIDFESGGMGADWTWEVAENDDNPAMEFIANPVSGGVNTSATVAKFTARSTGNPWALAFTDDNGQFTFDANNAMIKIMVYKPVVSDVAIKFEGGSAPLELKVANTLTNQWEELTFDFSQVIGNSYTRLVVIPDFKERTVEHIIYIDNIQLPVGDNTPQPEPQVAAPTPEYDAANVLSLFSNAYTDVAVDTWSADWDNAELEDVQIQGNDTKKYTNLTFAGIEFTSSTLNIADKDYFRFDMWTPDPIADGSLVKVKLVDFGADGAFDGGDDVEHEVFLSNASTPAIASDQWVTLDIPMTLFENLTTREHIGQLIIASDPSTVYIDNVIFYSGTVSGSAPEIAAPAPVHAANEVISLFSDAYTDVTVDTWSADWDEAEHEDLQIEGNNTKKYSSLNFAGIEFTSATIDASSMTHFHIDFWTKDGMTDPAAFKIKLVDFGADGQWQGGDDVEHEIFLNDASTPAVVSGEWNSIDIDLSDFTGLTTRGHLAQLILSGDPNTVFVDNIYFHTGVTSVNEISSIAPSEFDLSQNYPNPFNPTTNINFNIPNDSHVKLTIYNLLGEEVATLVNQTMNAGSYNVDFDASELNSGMYIYSITAGKFTATRKMMLIK